MKDNEILDAPLRTSIRFRRTDRRYRMRAFRYLIYLVLLFALTFYLRLNFLLNTYTTDSMARKGIQIAVLTQYLYFGFGVFFLVKSIRAGERTDAFKMMSAIGFLCYFLVLLVSLFNHFFPDFFSLS